ncbi:MAG: tRNA pseudouridine(55) synthase TruB [Longimicrobiales bacterium]
MTLKTSSDASYVLPVDKPVGPTSHDIVARARRALKTRRVGHTGTLDPFASGLLLLCVGNATRIAEYLTALPKTYEAELILGAATDTDDRTGTVISTSETWRSLDETVIRAAFHRWIGTHEQRPSQYSAKKIDGERAYDAARRGETVDIKPVSITIHDITIDTMNLPSVSFTVTCSSGTYIRALARDIGDALGTGAHLTVLRRTRVGAHDVAHAVPLDQLDDAGLVAQRALSPLAAVAHMPCIEIDDAGVREIGHGRALHMDAYRSAAGVAGVPAQSIVLTHDGELIAMAQEDQGLLRPKKVFAHG